VALLIAATPSAAMIFSSNCSAESFKIQAARTTIHSVALSPDGQLLCAGDTMGGVKVWDTATRKITASVKATQSKLTSISRVSFSPDGSLLQMTDFQKSITEVWECRSWKRTAVIDHKAHPWCVLFSTNNTLVTVVGHPIVIRHWDISRGLSIAEFKTGVSSSCEIAMNEGVTRVVLVANPSAVLTIWDLEKGKIGELPLHSRPVTAVMCVSDDLYVCSEDLYRVWSFDPTTGRVIHEGRADVGYMSVIARPKGATDVLVAGLNHTLTGYSGEISVWDTKSLGIRHKMETAAAIRAVDWCPKTGLIAAGCADGIVYLWTPENKGE
jgi:WD40 repeat protein